ncbi:cyclic AMP response element-binding protein A isoform X1 [Drosophila gunungcola]|nr:cyclic AMP response element-binding protein A isoform X1 [Drosophila gunungcola]
MEFYDGDLKDIWDSDLDPESLKISPDHDMHDWLFDRDVKDPTVILNDKLISDALLNGTQPIKTEHSYSLSSDVDSLPDSPKSLQAKMEDMDDECFPAISLKTATSGRVTIDPKCLTLHVPPTHATPISRLSSNPALNSSVADVTRSSGLQSLHAQHPHHGSGANHLVVANLEHFQLPQHLYDNDCSSSVSSMRDGSMSPDICSDIEIDESAIKDEPMSPDSSCPASPTSQASSSQHQLSLNLAHLQSEMLFEPRHGGLLLTASSNSNNSLIKSQQRQQQLLGQGDLLMAKMEIKSEKQNTSNSSSSSSISSSTSSGKSHAHGYGIPLTPPSSLPSDDSEGNLTPEHLFSPLSPNASVSISVANAAGGESSSSVRVSRTAAGITRSSTGSGSGSGSSSSSSTTATTTRQPIHTPLISSQPKGSTGTLSLTEEEKRTLLAEGYPIPQKLPLTKAEEKSLKKIRRKIKNKISAQESRRKKKEYMDQLERRVEILVTENHDYKKRLEGLEETNANLLSQLHKLQALVSKHNVKKS